MPSMRKGEEGSRPSSKVPLIVLAAAIAIAGVTYLNRADDESGELVREVRRDKRPVRTLQVMPAPRREVVEQTGVLAAARDVMISVEVGGKVLSIVKDMGDACERGQPLLRLDPESYQLALSRAEAALQQSRVRQRQARRDLERARKLKERAMTTAQMLERAQVEAESSEAGLLQAEAAVALARRNLRQSTVRCPFSGVVAERLVDQGQLVGPQTPLVRLVDVSQLKLTLTVSAAELARLRVGQRVALLSRSTPGVKAEGRVSRLGVAGDQVTRAYPVEVLTSGHSTVMRPGQVVRASVEVATYADALAVPVSALITHNDQKAVWRVVQGRVEPAVLTLGPRLDDLVLVEGGLSIGDVVVVVGGHGLAEGAAVEAVEAVEIGSGGDAGDGPVREPASQEATAASDAPPAIP